MALNVQSLIDAPIIELDTIDSTNNYAMRLIDADTAPEGLTIIAREQTQGKGQRGRVWESPVGQNLLMSLVVTPICPLDAQFAFNASIAVAVADVLQNLHEHWNIAIKWPNDIIVNDKKAGGILIENILRGNSWTYSIIGLGLNVLQTAFPAALPNAISLKMASGIDLDLSELVSGIRQHIFTAVCQYPDVPVMMDAYNKYLYKKEKQQLFADEGQEWWAEIIGVEADGCLCVRLNDGRLARYSHGAVQWVW